MGHGWHSLDAFTMKLYYLQKRRRESRFSWFGHMYRRLIDVVGRSDLITVDGRSKGIGTPKLTLKAVVQRIQVFVSWNTMPLTEFIGENGFM